MTGKKAFIQGKLFRVVQEKSLPSSPGCYLFLDSSGKVIYVGKAKDLKKRVSSYFSGREKEPKTSALVLRIASIDFIATKTEFEAFLLENNLIKKHQPKYNISLKDSKRYAYLQLTKEKFPRLLVSRKPEGVLGVDYFGPFVSGTERERVLSAVRKAFRIRTCKRLPKRECILKGMGLCDAPCVGGISEKGYSEEIGRARQVLSGRTGNVEGILSSEISALSKRREFELALRKRDQLRALKNLYEKRLQNVEKGFSGDSFDVVGSASSGAREVAVVLSFSGGLLLGKSDYEITPGAGGVPEFIERYYSSNPEKLPGKIFVREKCGPSLGRNLSRLSGKAVSIVSGGNPELLELAEKNASLLLEGGNPALSGLRDALSLGSLPETIECFDISHFGGEGTVGSMVFFKRGLPEKSSYRRFKIRSLGEGKIDDFASIGEVVLRRYSRLVSENSPLPDLIVIDGGAGQLSSAKKSLETLGLDLPIISLAKREEEIHLSGGRTLSLPKNSPALQLLQRIRDEAHRFAISYNRLLVGKKRKTS